MQKILDMAFAVRVWILAALDGLAVGRALTLLVSALHTPFVNLARRLLRAAPVLKKYEWLLEIDSFSRSRPFVPVVLMLYVIWRGLKTTMYGHIGTDSIIYPLMAVVSGYNPFLGCVCGALFGVADLIQKLVASDVAGAQRGVNLDYLGAMVGFTVGYFSLMMMGLLPGVLLRACRRGIRSILNPFLRRPNPASGDSSWGANTTVLFLGELAAGAIAGCLSGYWIMRYVAPVTNRPSFYWRPHPEGACYNLEVNVLRELRPAAASGGLIGGFVAAIQARRAVIFSGTPITLETFSECVRSVGGSVNPKRPSEGHLSRDGRRVWLFFQKREFTELSPCLEESVRQKLRKNPETNIVLEINRHPGSEQLAIEIASVFAAKVPVVVHNLRAPAGVFSREDLADMQARGRDLF